MRVTTMSLEFWLVFFSIFCVFIIVNDFWRRKISNRMLVVVLVFQAICLSLNSFGFTFLGALPDHLSWSQCITGFVMGLLVFFPFWGFKLVGAGDVKLIATLGFLLGFAGLWQVVLVATALTGLHAVVTIMTKGWFLARIGWWQESKEQRRGVPYGAWLGITALAWVLLYYRSGHAWL